MKHLFLPLSFVLLSSFGSAQTRPADLVVINAKVRTMTATTSVAEGFAVTGNRITAVGTTKLIKRLIGPSTRVIDAGGRLVLPGFNDAHVHFTAIGNTFSSLNLRPVNARTVTIALVSFYTGFLPKGRWLLGGNWQKDNWELPDFRSIDAISRDTPIFLYQAGGEAAFANSLAFERARLTDDSKGVDRDANGESTGIVRGDALKKIAAAVPKNHTSNWPEIAETATNYAASLGVTSVQDMHSDDSREIYRELQRQGKLKTRIYDCLPLPDWNKLRTSRLPAQSGEMVSDGCLKSFSDGEEAAKAGLLREVVSADKAGLQIMIHAIGRSANKIVLDVFEEAARTNGIRDRRFRIEHAHNAAESDLSRFKQLGVIASMQPFLFEGSHGSRYGTLLRQNAKVAFGSDASMVDLNPLLGIHAAITSDDPISVYDAVRAYTFGSAYAEFQETQKGTIERGKLADFVILSDDIFTVEREKIRSAKVVLTAVDGRIVYQTN